MFEKKEYEWKIPIFVKAIIWVVMTAVFIFGLCLVLSGNLSTLFG